MSDFFKNSFDYRNLRKDGELYMSAKDCDTEGERGKIDTAHEKSIFLSAVHDLVAEGCEEANALFGENGFFGVEYSENLKYDGAQESEAKPEVEEEATTDDDDTKDIKLLYTKKEKDKAKRDGEGKGALLFRYLDGLNFRTCWFGMGGHEKAEALLKNDMADSSPLEFAYMINRFNKNTSFDTNTNNGKGICEFIMDECWDEEENCLQLITNKVMDMYDALEHKDKLKEIPDLDTSVYTILNEIKIVANSIEDYDDPVDWVDKNEMPKIDKFIKQITDKYIKEFG